MSTTAPREIELGERAPDFTLPSTAGGTVTLSSFRGRKHVLLAFFPLAFTRVCAAEMCSFWNDAGKFEAADTKVFGISVDHTASQKAFQEKEHFRTDLLSDFRREVSRAWGVLLEEHQFTKRAYFLVDKEGIVRWKNVESSLADVRDNAEILSAVRTLA